MPSYSYVNYAHYRVSVTNIVAPHLKTPTTLYANTLTLHACLHSCTVLIRSGTADDVPWRRHCACVGMNALAGVVMSTQVNTSRL